MLRFATPLFLLAVTPLVATDPPKAGRKVAFLVGVGDYKHHKKDNQLGAAPVNDVTEMAKLLKANGFTVVLLTDADATRDAVLEKFRLTLNGQVKPTDKKDAMGNKDVLLVMLCGHGIQVEATIPDDPDDKERKNKQLQPFFQTHDTKPTDTDTMVPFNLLVKEAGENRVRTLFLVDACRENTDPNLRGATRTGISRGKAVLPDGVSILYSCSEGELANQDKPTDPKGQGLFTRTLLRTLRGETGLKEEVSWSELVADVSKNFRRDKELKARIPENRTQTPDAPQGGGATDVVLVTLGRKGGDEVEFEIADGVKMTFCWIPPGIATLGSPKSEAGRRDDEKEHEYETKTGFWLGKYEVTQAEWSAVMKTTPFYFHAKGDGKERVKGLDTSRFPAENVSWDDTQEFLKAVNKRVGAAKAFGAAGRFRLPHEDEWEYAYRGGKGNKQPFYWGDTLNGDNANCDGGWPYGTVTKGANLKRPSVVGSYAKAAHLWGPCDMAGNVWEWCDNWSDSEQGYRSQRGGAWLYYAGRCRAAERSKCIPAARRDDDGFRVVFCLD